jgi:hypothetical protein
MQGFALNMRNGLAKLTGAEEALMGDVQCGGAPAPVLPPAVTGEVGLQPRLGMQRHARGQHILLHVTCQLCWTCPCSKARCFEWWRPK